MKKKEKEFNIQKKLKIKKLKFLKELNYTVDVQTGGCGYCGGCSHWC